MYYELIGVLATLLILAGFMYSEERTIRRFNVVGALLFVLYGLLINSLSNVLLNAILVLVHVYKLTKKEGESHCEG